MKKKVFNIIQIGDKSNRLSRLFDIFIAIVICANILVTFLQTFDELAFLFPVFHVVEVLTILIFCVEYILRIWTADYLYPDKNEFRSRLRFLISFDGIIDLLTILPFFFLSGMVIFRMLRVARIFHLFRLNARYDSFNVITTVLYEKRNQIISSVFIVLILMLASSLCMYSVEHDSQPEVFRNAFSGIWWSMSTLLTVGYGDIYPITTLGRIKAMILKVAPLKADQVIENVTDMSQYGLADPERTIQYETADRSVIINVGNLNSMTSQYYIAFPSEMKVYVVATNVVTGFNYTLDDLVEETTEETESTEAAETTEAEITETAATEAD